MLLKLYVRALPKDDLLRLFGNENADLQQSCLEEVILWWG